MTGDHTYAQKHENNGEGQILRINSFFPTSNNTHASFDFLDEKIVIKRKSFTADFENEVKYEDIKHILIINKADTGWLWLGLEVIAISGGLSLILSAFGLHFLNNPVFLIVAKAIVLIGIILCIPAFHKYTLYLFLDRFRNSPVVIKEDIDNYQALEQAVQLVRQKTTILSETNPEMPFPDASPVFVCENFSLTNSLNRSVARFYEDRLIEKQKSLAEDIFSVVNYSELSGKVVRIKAGDNNWCSVGLGLFFLYIDMYWSLDLFFHPAWQAGWKNHIWLILACLPLLIMLLSWVKREMVAFLGRDGHFIWGMWSISRNPKMMDDIVEYVKSKTASPVHPQPRPVIRRRETRKSSRRK